MMEYKQYDVSILLTLGWCELALLCVSKPGISITNVEKLELLIRLNIDLMKSGQKNIINTQYLPVNQNM